MRILLWHVHGGWTDAFVRGDHEYVMPRTSAGGPWGLGTAGRDWPRARDADADELRHMDIDVVLLQRPAELRVAAAVLGRRPGRDIPAVYVEHNTPRASVPDTKHPLAERDDITLVHVTEFNRLMWDSGRAPVRVIEHGLPDPGYRYTGELPHLAFVGNEPVRRARVLGTDLLPHFARVAPVDLFGMGCEQVAPLLRVDGLDAIGDLRPEQLRAEVSRRRVYLHPVRWTSLGLSLVESMLLGMPVVVLAMTEAATIIPREAGAVGLDVPELARAAGRFVADPDAARAAGRIAREAALERFGHARFLAQWDEVLSDAVARHARRQARRAPVGAGKG